MASIENLVNKILGDAKAEADKIIAGAEAEKAKIVDKKVKEAEEIKADMLSKSEREAATRKSRVVSNAQLKIRNNKLEAKQEVVDKAFEEALNKLNKIDENAFKEYVQNIILGSPINGDEEVIIDSKYRTLITDEFLNDINEKLSSQGKQIELKISSEERNLNGGFIIAKNGIELNYTFDALINSLKDEIEGEVIKSLFA